MIKSKPLATVFIPSYNAGPHLLEAVASVFAQTVADWELLIVDDGSTDGSVEAVQQHFDDPRLRVERLPHNMGTAAARNRGLALARGEFLINLDADDLALPERIALQTAFFRAHPNVDVLTGAMELFGADGIHGITQPPVDNADLQAHLLACSSNIANPASAVRMRFVREHGICFDPALRVAQDLDFWIACACQGAQLAGQREVVTRYRVHANQAVQKTEALIQGQKTALTRLLQAWFPQLPAPQASALAVLMVPTKVHVIDIPTIQAGFHAAGWVYRQNKTAAGAPDMDTVYALIRAQMQRWMTSLQKA